MASVQTRECLNGHIERVAGIYAIMQYHSRRDISRLVWSIICKAEYDVTYGDTIDVMFSLNEIARIKEDTWPNFKKRSLQKKQ